TEFDAVKRLRLTAIFGMEDDQAFPSRCIVDSDQTPAVIEPFKETISHTVKLTMLQDRSLPVAHSERLTTCCERYRIALWMHGIGVKVATGWDELAIALCTYARQHYIQFAYFFS